MQKWGPGSFLPVFSSVHAVRTHFFPIIIYSSKKPAQLGKIFVNLDSAIMIANIEMSTNGKSSQIIPQMIFARGF